MGEGRATTATVPVHYLRYNEREWSPRAVAFFDTETRAVAGTEPERNELVLWCAESIIRSKKPDVPDRELAGTGHTGQALATWIADAFMGHKVLWLYAHNLSFDLFTTRLLTWLFADGWALTGAFSISDHAPFFRLRRGSKRLVITDSWSWLPEALRTIGEAVQLPKPPMPAAGDLEALQARCGADVAILRAAVLQLMDWWDRQQCGNWTITGASTGWNACRHKMAGPRILIDPEPAGRAHDNSAVYGGRRDAWRVGQFKTGPYVELDFKEAHPTIVANLPLPHKRGSENVIFARHGATFMTDQIGWIARCVVQTDQPRYPVKVGKETWYPVGRFETVLCGPELRMAEERGELVSVSTGRLHRLGTSLQPWGRWVTQLTTTTTPETPAVARLAAKGWGRSVIGKWSARRNELIERRPAINGPYFIEHGWTNQTGCPLTLASVGDTEYTLRKDRWTDSAYPAVWAWVESELRVRLATVIDALPYSSLITCNTDGLIVDAARLGAHLAATYRLHLSGCTDVEIIRQWCELISQDTWPLVLRIKNVFRELNVLGPAQMEVDRKRRWSGVRTDAVQTGPLEFQGRQWPKMAWQMNHFTGHGYLRPTVTVRPKGPFVHRWNLNTGNPAPIVMVWDNQHGNRILPWLDAYPDSAQFPLSPHQHKQLADEVLTVPELSMSAQ